MEALDKDEKPLEEQNVHSDALSATNARDEPIGTNDVDDDDQETTTRGDNDGSPAVDANLEPASSSPPPPNIVEKRSDNAQERKNFRQGRTSSRRRNIEISRVLAKNLMDSTVSDLMSFKTLSTWPAKEGWERRRTWRGPSHQAEGDASHDRPIAGRPSTAPEKYWLNEEPRNQPARKSISTTRAALYRPNQKPERSPIQRPRHSEDRANKKKSKDTTNSVNRQNKFDGVDILSINGKDLLDFLMMSSALQEREMNSTIRVMSNGEAKLSMRTPVPGFLRQLHEFLRRELLGIDRSFLVALKHTLNLQSHNVDQRVEDERGSLRPERKVDVEQSFRALDVQNTEDQNVQEESFLNELKKSWISSRLNIYRRCFQHLCDNFKIYGELMTEIKAAYENMITIIRDDSSLLSASNKSLKQGFSKTEQELIVRSRRWKIAREEFERSIEDLQNEIRRLKEHLQPLETQLAEKDEELRYMKRKLSEELKANNTLVKAIERKNEDHVEIMKALKIDSSKLRLQMQEQSIEAEELRRQNKRLAERNLEKDDLIAQLNKELSVSRQEIEKLKNENSDIMIKMEKAEEQVDELTQAAGTLTPRPDLDDFLEGESHSAIRKNRSGKSTNEFAKWLVMELQRLNLQPQPDSPPSRARAKVRKDRRDDSQLASEPLEGWSQSHWNGQGTGEDVPKFLRFSGKIPNKKMSKRECETHVEEIWDMRSASPNQANSMEDSFYDYLNAKFELASAVAEWGYNIYYSAQRYRESPQLLLFAKVLAGHLPEKFYHEQMVLIDNFKALLGALDQKQNESEDITSTIQSALSKFFPAKAEEFLNDIVTILEAADGKSYSKLFEPEKDGSQSELEQTIRSQHIREYEDAIAQVDSAITELVESSKSAESSSSPPLLPVERVRGALEAISTTAEINVTQLVNLAVEIDLTNQDSKNVANSTSSDELVSRDSILQVSRCGNVITFGAWDVALSEALEAI